MRVLFVSPYLPSPVRVRPYQWVRALARQGVRVQLVALRPPEDRWLVEPPVADCCEKVTVFPLSRFDTLRNAVSALPGSLPLQAAYSLHPEAERFIAEQAKSCNVVHVEHLRGSLLARRVQDVPCVIDAVDSISALFSQAATQAPSWRQRLVARADLARTRRFEARVPSLFHRTIVSSRRDEEAFLELAGQDAVGRVVTVPNGVDLEYFHTVETPRDADTVLFTGKMSYHANEAAALQLAERIMPIVWERCPHARLVIAGKDPSEAVRQLGRDSRVTVTGFVDDLRPFFWSATVVVAPLVYGAGIQNKVLEAMACGTPVVASRSACEGIGAPAGQALMVAVEPRDMAAHVVSLFRDPTRREMLGAAGRRYVERHHDWYQMGRRLVAVYEEAQSEYRRCA